MKARLGITLAVLAIFLTGCASPPQHSVDLADDAISSNAGRIGVAMTALPKIDTHLPGADCLLCLAAASVANSSLTTHTRTLPYEDLPKLKNDVADLIRKKGSDAAVIAEEIKIDALADYDVSGPNIAKKDFRPLQKQYGVDKLLVINIHTLGVIRQYASYIPTSDPKAVLRGTGYMVNLKNNTYEWYMPVEVTKSADTKWDEPPKYPGLTNAYFQTLELSKDRFFKPFNN